MEYEEINKNSYKNILKRLIKSFDSICRINTIRYSIMYGTMLGAVRHKGFIPWDDDIDIFIPRDDFNRLCDVLKNNVDFGIVSVETTRGYKSIIPKFIDKHTRVIELDEGDKKKSTYNSCLGMYIDLFVLDRIPDCKFFRKIAFEIQDFLQLAWSFSYLASNNKHGSIINRIRSMANASGISVIIAKIMNTFAKHYSRKGKQLCNMLKRGMNKYRNSYVVDMVAFDELIELVFEGEELLSLKNYSYWLTNEYGDYMKLPPKKDRIFKHNYIAYYIRD